MAARSFHDFADGRAEIGEPDANDGSTERSAREDGAQDTGRHMPDGFLAPTVDPALSRTIESEIIPRLLLAHRDAVRRQSSTATDPQADMSDIERLVTISIAGTQADTHACIESLRARGLSIEAIITEVLPAAARHVGWLWETDARTFVDVTFSLSRLQQALRHYAPSLETQLPQLGEGRRVLLSAMPTEQHTFGLGIVEEFFRRAGWDVVPQTPAAIDELVGCVANEWFDVVGLSASGDKALSTMTATIQGIRSASLNQSVRVIVGGAAVMRCPEIAATVGADSIASDARDGITQMEWMMRALQQPC